MKKIKTKKWKFEEIGAGAAWLIINIDCPNCGFTKNIKTIDYWNCETKQTCEKCKCRFIIKIID